MDLLSGKVVLETGKTVMLPAALINQAIVTKALWQAGHHAKTELQAQVLELEYTHASNAMQALEDAFYTSNNLTEEEQEELEQLLVEVEAP